MLTASPWITTIAPAAALGVAVGLYGVIHPRARLWGPVIARGTPTPGHTHRPRVALTFGHGPCPPSTPAVLDALAKVQAQATFFVIGQNVRSHPHLLARIHAEGHLIANHSHTHPRPRQGLRGLRFFWRRQLDACDDAIHDVIEKRPTFFRPPMGLKHWPMLKEVTWGGQTCVTWTRRARDGKASASPRRIVRRLTKRLRDGDIYQLHDGHEPDHPCTRPHTHQHTADAIPALVNQIRDHGFDLVRLDELLGQPGYLETESHPQAAQDEQAILPSALATRRTP